MKRPRITNATVIDAGGSTLVPGMVDAHSHITLPGGSHWIELIMILAACSSPAESEGIQPPTVALPSA
jgi:dihydroorotase-like cyclic amidohydrolase